MSSPQKLLLQKVQKNPKAPTERKQFHPQGHCPMKHSTPRNTAVSPPMPSPQEAQHPQKQSSFIPKVIAPRTTTPTETKQFHTQGQSPKKQKTSRNKAVSPPMPLPKEAKHPQKQSSFTPRRRDSIDLGPNPLDGPGNNFLVAGSTAIPERAENPPIL